MAAGCGGGEALFPFSADTLDVEAYASRYKGRTRLVRLLFIAERCGVEETELQALRMAHDEAMDCGDALLYRDAALRINGRLGPRYVYEDAWIDSFDRLASEAREPAATWTCTDCSDSVHTSSSSAAPARATTTGSGDAGGGGGADLLAAIRGIGTHASSSSVALARATTTSSGAAGGGDGADLLAAIRGIGTHASSSSAAPARATNTSSGPAEEEARPTCSPPSAGSGPTPRSPTRTSRAAARISSAPPCRRRPRLSMTTKTETRRKGSRWPTSTSDASSA